MLGGETSSSSSSSPSSSSLSAAASACVPNFEDATVSGYPPEDPHERPDDDPPPFAYEDEQEDRDIFECDDEAHANSSLKSRIRGRGRPPNKVGSSTNKRPRNVLEPEDMKLITESAIDAKLSPNRCQRNNGQKQYPSYRLPTGKGLPAERFREIPDLPEHISWDIGALYERGKSRKTSTHQCGVCAAIGPVFGPNGDRYRGNVMTVRRAILMCKHSGCLLGYCSASCFNLWHHNEELPENMAHKRSSRMR